ncbi:MAG: phosphoribosylamine--glycine ligase, partial [Pseudomonadota bacterium]
GGREHALCACLAKSAGIGKLFCAPGNAGIRQVAECVVLDVANAAAVVDFCRLHNIGFVIVGPEVPLVAGLVDVLQEANITAFGPSAAAAKLEGSKTFTKQLCDEARIPTAEYDWFDTAESAKAFVAAGSNFPSVVKADGLAAGKGVVIADNAIDALAAIDACFDGSVTGQTDGCEVVIEEFLTGEEASLFVLCDGETAKVLGTAQDHKRAYDGDEGPNTGGMGAYAPAPVMTDARVAQAMSKIIEPTLATLRARGTPYRGVLYAGLMITEAGPKLIEYNVRFGDPECQVLLPLIENDLLEVLYATATGRLGEVDVKLAPAAALTVVMAAKGYPGPVEKGGAIGRVATAEEMDGVQVFHAGTAFAPDGSLTANGGRVLNVTAVAPELVKARDAAYAAVEVIDWPDHHHRTDIGWRVLKSVS